MYRKHSRILVEPAHGSFLSWAKHADAEGLVNMIRVCGADGAELVSRSRGGGRRSEPRMEPLIFGHVRGAIDNDIKGGRPRHSPQDDLVMHLAIDWSIATGATPSPGRSDHRGFGDLVHCVFQWLEEPSPDQALRRYWKVVKTAPIPFGQPSLSS